MFSPEQYQQSLKPHRASLLIQMLLQLNVYITMLWSGCYFIHMVTFLERIWNLKGLLMVVVYFVAIITDSLRIYAGYCLNLCDSRAARKLLWLMLIPFVLLPSLVYLRLITFGQPVWLELAFYMQYAIMATEGIVAIIWYMRGGWRPTKREQPIELQDMQWSPTRLRQRSYY